MNNEPQIAPDDVSREGKLTDWVNEPTILTLKDDLAISQQSHDAQVTKINDWLDIRNVTGKAKPKTKKNRSAVQTKLVRRQAEWRYSALSEPFLSSDNIFKVKPVTFEDGAGAKQNQLVLESQFRTKLNRVAFIDEYVRTTVDEGSVAVRLGWCRETEIEMVDAPVWEYAKVNSQGQFEELKMASEMKEANPNGFLDLPEEIQEAVNYSFENQIPVTAQIIGYEKVEQEKVLKNQPTIDITDFQNLYLDPAANGDIDKAGFAVISFETSKAKLLKDGRYSNLDNISWSNHTPLSEPDHATTTDDTMQFKDDLRKVVIAYEYWGWYDVHSNDKLVPIVATWIGNTIIRMEENPFPDKKLPLVIVPYMPLKKSLTGEPDAELLGDNQAIHGAISRGMIDLLGRSANSQMGTAKGMLDPVNKRRRDEGDDYEFNPNLPPNVGMHQHQFPDIPNSALTMLQLQDQDAEALTGIKAFSGGLSGEAYGDVAAGIRGMLDAASKREMAILRRLAKGIQDIGSKIITMNQVFLSEEEVVRITNDTFVTVRREDLAGNYDLIVDISTAEVDEAQAQDLSFMLQTMGPNMDFSMTQLILVEIATLKRMPELAKKIEDFQPTPDPMEEQLKQMEIQKLQAEIEEIQSKTALNQAKTKVELSTADMTDLDYVEQETGTKHARDIDKQGAQADANIELEIAKAALAPPPNQAQTGQH